MKAISLFQPWASLVAIGAKTWETRCWGTAYRGRIAIHATKTLMQEQFALANSEFFQPPLAEAGFVPMLLPLGAIIAVARVTECITSSQWLDRYEGRPEMRSEFEFGDYSAGRFAWRLEGVQRLKVSVPCRGMQRIWNVPTEIATEVERRLL